MAVQSVDAPVRAPTHFHDLDAEVLDVRPDGLEVMRMDGLGENDLLLALGQALREQHRLTKRGRAVVERGVRDVEAGQQALVRLVFEDRLQRPLRDFRLIRRVRRQELGAREELVDHGRLVVRVRAAAEE